MGTVVVQCSRKLVWTDDRCCLVKVVQIDDQVSSKQVFDCDFNFGDQYLQWLGDWMEKCVDWECEGRKVEPVDRLPGLRWIDLMEIRARDGQYQL